MTVVKRHFSAFSRMVHEAIRIELLSKQKNLVEVLNSRSEIGRVVLPRLVVEQDDDGGGKDKGAGLECQDSIRAGLEGGGGGHNKLGSQSENISTFNFITGSGNTGLQSGGAFLK